ncbi:hypothetical protein KY311_02530 [Candidatus Woesearchaeota archaeon]|nr:hypothetical protein [Candidatus Woesearchaeota archaeon]
MKFKYDNKDLGNILHELCLNQNPGEGSRWTSFEITLMYPFDVSETERSKKERSFVCQDMASFYKKIFTGNGSRLPHRLIARITYHNCNTQVVIDRETQEIDYNGYSGSINRVLEQHATLKQ